MMPHESSFCFSAASGCLAFDPVELSGCIFSPPSELVGWRAAEKQKERLFGSRLSINRPPLRGLSNDLQKLLAR